MSYFMEYEYIGDYPIPNKLGGCMIIKIESVEQKTGGTGRRFWVVKADKGQWNVFDPKFKDLVGTTVEVSTTQNGKFENIELLRTGVAPEQVTATQAGYTPSTKVYSSFDDAKKTNSMVLSYAKDLTVAVINKEAEGFKPDQIVTMLDYFYRFLKDTLNEDNDKTEEALL